MYFLMIKSSLCDHLLGLKDLTVTPVTSLSVSILSLNKCSTKW